MGEIGKIVKSRSLNDIYDKANRLYSQAWNAGDRTRAERIKEIRDRYVSNIKSTKEYAFDQKKGKDQVAEAVEAARKKGYTTAEQANRDKKLTKMYGTYRNDFFNKYIESVYTPGTYGRKYSQSVYARKNNRS